MARDQAAGPHGGRPDSCAALLPPRGIGREFVNCKLSKRHLRPLDFTGEECRPKTVHGGAGQNKQEKSQEAVGMGEGGDRQRHKTAAARPLKQGGAPRGPACAAPSALQGRARAAARTAGPQ